MKNDWGSGTVLFCRGSFVGVEGKRISQDQLNSVQKKVKEKKKERERTADFIHRMCGCLNSRGCEFMLKMERI